MQVMAEVLGVSAEQSLPNENYKRIDICTFTDIGGGMVWLQIDKIVPYKLALGILKELED